MLTARYPKLDVIILFLASLIFFTAGLSSEEITGFDSRFYLFAQQMSRYGVSWFPMTYHQPYPDYPALSTLLIYASSILFGGFSKFVAVLPTAIMAAMTVTITSLIGNLHNRHWGYCAAMLVFLTSAFFKSARGISLDMYPAMITAMCFYLVYSADKENKPKRILWIYPLLLLGFAFRGPIGLVIPAGVICFYYLINRNLKSFFLNGFIAFILLGMCTVLLLMLAYHLGGNAFMNDVLRMEIVGRMDNAWLPRYYYFTSSMSHYALTYPLALLVASGLFYYAYDKNIIFPDKKFLLQLFGWMMVILIGMSIPDDKKIRYILPMMPAIALMAAYPFAAPSSQRYFVLLRAIIRHFLRVLPFLFLVLALIIQYNLHNLAVPVAINFKIILSIFAIMQVVNLALYYFIQDVDSREKILASVGVFSFVIANIMILEPIQLYIDRARDFVLSTEGKRIQEKARLVFYRESPDGLPIKYLLNMNSEDQPVFIWDQKALTDFSGPAYFVTSESYYNELTRDAAVKFSVIARESLGHVRVIVFRRKQEGNHDS